MASPFFLMNTTIGDAHGDIKGRMIFDDKCPLISLPIYLKILGQPAVPVVQLISRHRHRYRIPHCVTKGVKHCLLQSGDACSSISTVAASLNLQITAYQDLQIGDHQWVDLSTMFQPQEARLGAVRHLPRITKLLHINTLVEKMALLPSHPAACNYTGLLN